MGVSLPSQDVNVTARAQDWALAFFSSQDCNVKNTLFTDEGDEEKGCTDIPTRAYSAQFNGNDEWYGLLYYQSECGGGSRSVGPGLSGCVFSEDGWDSYEVFGGP